MADKQAKLHANVMLTQHLNGPDPVLFATLNGSSVKKHSPTSFRRKFFVILPDHKGQRIEDVTMYVANLCGLRLDKWNNATSRYTPSEVVTMVEARIGRSVRLVTL